MYICLLVNAALREDSPQRRPTMHVVGLHSLDCLQIVGIGRLLISNDNADWKSEHRGPMCIGTSQRLPEDHCD